MIPTLKRGLGRCTVLKHIRLATIAVVVTGLVPSVPVRSLSPDPLQTPLPEHPRPDFERAEWQNLNGPWQFQFDGQDVGESRGWPRAGLPAPRPIVVPFPWGSPLSGVPDSAPIAWYARTITLPAAWTGKRVFLVIGAADRHAARAARRRPGDLRGGDPERAPVVARGPVPVRDRSRGGRRSRAELLRDAKDLRRRPARNGLPLRRPERRAALPAAHARPGVPPRGVLHLPERLLRAFRDSARQADRPDRAARARESRVATQALLGRPAGALDHGGRAQLVGRARLVDAPRGRVHAPGDGGTRLQPSRHLRLGAVQRDVGAVHEGRAEASLPP